MHGNGKFTFKDKKEYNGQYFEDAKHGFGIMKFNDGTQYEGEWEKGF